MPSAKACKSGAGDEMRVHPRLKCKGIARVRLLPQGSWVDGVLSDLSLRGCCIEVEQPMHGETDCAVEVLLTVKGTNLRLNGAIRYMARHLRAGIQFLDVSPRKGEQIEELMADLLEMDKLAALGRLTQPSAKNC